MKKPLAALVLAFLASSLSVHATTTSGWIASSPADYSASAANWSPSGVPSGSTYYVLFTNGVACGYTNSDSYTLGGMFLATNVNAPNGNGTFNMNGGTLLLSNSVNQYIVTMGGGYPGINSLSGVNGNGSGTFSMSAGQLTVIKASSVGEQQDGFMLGLGTNSTGTFSLSGGTATMLCGIEIGMQGAGILNVSGTGTLIANSWFHIGQGANSTTIAGLGSGVFNLSGGTVYILRNSVGSPSSFNGGLTIGQNVTNATANISGGALYCYNITFSGEGIANSITNTLNMSGGTIYVGPSGVSSNINSANIVTVMNNFVNISGGTFHTADYATNSGAAASNGNTNNILSDGTNWNWNANVPANLTNTSFTVNGVAGPGYATFAPESTRTITLSNVWSGVGGMSIAGPGTVILAATNTYAGPTTVSGGTLDINATGTILGNVIVSSGATLQLDNSNAVTTSASLSVGSGSTINLTYSGTHTIGALSIGGVPQPAGVYGATASDPGGIFAGAGTVTVSAASYPTPVFTSVALTGTTTLTISATNGLANGTYYLLESTNVSLPPRQWNVIYTNTFNGSGAISGRQIPVAHPGDAREFYMLLQSTNAAAFP